MDSALNGVIFIIIIIIIIVIIIINHGLSLYSTFPIRLPFF